jgi:hypothetical protein
MALGGLLMTTFDISFNGHDYLGCEMVTVGKFESGELAFEIWNDGGPVTRVNVALPFAPAEGAM